MRNMASRIGSVRLEKGGRPLEAEVLVCQLEGLQLGSSIAGCWLQDVKKLEALVFGCSLEETEVLHQLPE